MGEILAAENLPLAGQQELRRNSGVENFPAYVAACERFDPMLVELLSCPGFREPQTPDDCADWPAFKLEVIVYFYKKSAKREIMSGRINALCLSKELP
ncbi:MAG: hypothetical protein WA735_21315 [Candidatus Acidiferrales bacterium]